MTKRRYYLRFNLVSQQRKTQKELINSERGKLPFQISLTVSNIFVLRCSRNVCGEEILAENCWKNSLDIYHDLHLRCIKWNSKPMDEYEALVKARIGKIEPYNL